MSGSFELFPLREAKKAVNQDMSYVVQNGFSQMG